MDRTQAINEIKARWKEFYPADGNGHGKGIICPICGSGSGKHGTGIVENPKSRNHSLTCFACSFSGSVIDLHMKTAGMDAKADFSKAVDEMAALIGISIEPDTRRPTAKEEFAEPQGTESTFTSEESAAETKPEADAIQPAPAKADYSDYYERCSKNLINNEAAQAYLKGRGIGYNIPIEQYANGLCIGFDPAWISPTVIRNQHEKGSNWLPEPKPVIILPSRKTHYVARDIRPAGQLDEQQRRFAKMNEGEPGIFNESWLSKVKIAFICEGAIDALSIIEAGATPTKAGAIALALNSTANAEKLLKELEQTPTDATLILCLDNDEAGKAATEKLKAGLRRLNISFISSDINCGHKDPNEALTANRAEFEKAVAMAMTRAAAKPDNTSSYLDNLMAEEIEKFKQGKDRLTGFKNLDEKAGGLNAGLYVLSAITSLGKTTLALQMADQLAAAGHDVIFFSMEQSRLEMVTKSLARLTAQADMKTAVTSLAIRKGYFPGQVITAAETYRQMVSDRLSIVEGNFNCDIAFIGDYLRRFIDKNNCRKTGRPPIVFIDYLQVLQPATEGKSKGSKKDEIDLDVIELKRLSRELDLPIIVISSINRANYLTPFSFESLKESGGIEFTADVIWGLQLACLDDELFEKEGGIKAKRDKIKLAKAENPRKIKLVCLKNRYGISNFDCSFEYYPEFDLFIPAADSTGAARLKANRVITAGGKHR